MRITLPFQTSIPVTALVLIVITAQGHAQSSRRPVRVEAPTFEAKQFEGIFFDKPASQLQGSPPATDTARIADIEPGREGATAGDASGAETTAADSMGWRELISPTSLEDLIKAGKLRLEKVITTPTAFKGGGFVTARTEFSLQALMFAIIETYPGDVRWKSNAAEARQRMTRVAANTKVGSDQVFSEAKARLLDLDDLLSGSNLSGRSEGNSEIDWSKLIDRVPLMQLMEWAQEKNLNKLVASEGQFKDSSEEVLRYAELIAVLGKVALADEMPDASDDDYAALSRSMIAAAQQVALAAKTGNAELARSAAGQIGQSCTNCHDSFR